MALREVPKIVIAGASSLIGAELRSLLEESRFAASDFHLVDEPIVAGVLTEAAGEPAVIQPVDADSFVRASTVFFTGSAEFTRANLEAAQKSGARVIDLSGGSACSTGSSAWFPRLDWLRGREFAKDGKVFCVPSAAATEAASMALALSKIGVSKLSVVCFQPVSDTGRAGIEELETQTGQLLSFQGVGQPVFDTQVAFNLLERFGPSSKHSLQDIKQRVRLETKACLGEQNLPAIQVVHAPVFYGSAFSACAQIEGGKTVEEIIEACRGAGFITLPEGDAGPGNVSSAGEKVIQISRPEEDPSQPGTWWIWGAADNIRLPAANAVKLAEMLS